MKTHLSEFNQMFFRFKVQLVEHICNNTKDEAIKKNWFEFYNHNEFDQTLREQVLEGHSLSNIKAFWLAVADNKLSIAKAILRNKVQP